MAVAGGAAASAVVLSERQARLGDHGAGGGQLGPDHGGVPGGSAGELRDSGWTPKDLAPALRDGHEPGLAVADDLAKWQKTGSDVNGVFIGLSEQGDLATVVGAITHSGCHYAGSRSFASRAARAGCAPS